MRLICIFKQAWDSLIINNNVWNCQLYSYGQSYSYTYVVKTLFIICLVFYVTRGDAGVVDADVVDSGATEQEVIKKKIYLTGSYEADYDKQSEETKHVSSLLHEVRALVTSRNWAVMSSEIIAPIANIPIHPGQRFKKGDVLVKFDCATYEAQRAGGAAEVRQANAQLESLQRLLQLQSVGALEVEIARTNLDRAKANLQLLDVYLERCTVIAPYSGSVVQWIAQPYQTVGAGDDIIEIVGSRGIELELIVPSSWLVWLKTGQTLVAHIDETGLSVPGTISHLGARIDPVSQTIKVYAVITEGGENLLPGMSGRAMIPSL